MTKLVYDSRVCWWLLLGFVLAAPFLTLTGIPIAWNAIPLMDWQRLLEAAILLSCLGWAITFAPPLTAIPGATLFTWATVLTLGLASALTVANQVGFALLEWSWLLMLAMLATMMHQWPPENRRSLNKLILLTVFISSLAYLWWWWRLNAAIYFEPAESGVIRRINFPGFSNVRFFSDYQSFMLFLLPISLYHLTEKGWARNIGTVLVSLYFTLALIAGSRSVIATQLVLHTTLWLTLRHHYRPILHDHLRFWSYGGLIFIFLTWILPRILFGGAGDSLVASSLARADSSLRTELWALAWQYIQTHPWLGLGPMQYAAIPNPIAAHPHNLIMQFASEWGIPATLLLSWLVLRIIIDRFKRLIPNHDAEMDYTALAMTCAGTALMIQSMVAGALNYPVTQVMALMFFAYPSTYTNTEVSVKKTSDLHFIALAAALMTVATLTSLHSVQQRNQCFWMTHWPTQHYAPRFWQHGWIMGECGQGEMLLPLPKSLMQRGASTVHQESD